MIRQTKGEKIFSVFNYIFLGLIALATLYPFIYVFSASTSSPELVVSGNVWLFPKGFNLEAYRYVIAMEDIWIAYGNTLFYTIFGVAVNITLTVLGAYPLSKTRLKGRTVIGFAIAFTMWFQAGIVPFYLNIRDLNLLNTRTAIIFAFGVTTFFVILLRTFFQSIPDSLEEAAKIDGASDFQVLTKIFLPLSKPALATIALFYAVQRWNGFFWAMVLLRDDSKIPIQVLLRKLVVELNMSDELSAMMDRTFYSAETVIYATIVVAIIPIVLVYPFIQKFFVKGIMVGSVKG